MSNPWKASDEVVQILDLVKSKHHSPRIDDCRVAVCFDDSKPFVKNKLNLGKLSKFSSTARLWQREKYDFCLIIPIPEVIEENGKKIKLTDEFGRIQYSKVPKEDKEGNVKWKIDPLNLEVFAKNVRKYGLWQEDLLILKEAILAVDGGTSGQVKDN
jgi:hypothetical protein